MTGLLKRLATWLPSRCQQELKRLYFARLIRKGLFQKAIEDEGEFDNLDRWVGPGDWALDVGANVGNYAARLSELVESSGRVLAFEPIPQTFELLAANVARFPLQNVTLFNVAASSRSGTLGMRIPRLSTGASNPYMAYVTDENREICVLCIQIDSLDLQHPVRFVKLDVEGHELPALQGMSRLIERDHPVLVVEGRSPDVAAYLEAFGYSYEQHQRSPNRVFQFAGTQPC